MRELREALKLIKNDKVYGVEVDLHILKGPGYIENWDFTGEHKISIGVKIKKFDPITNEDRCSDICHTIELSNWKEKECKIKHREVFRIIKGAYPGAEKNIYVHD